MKPTPIDFELLYAALVFAPMGEGGDLEHVLKTQGAIQEMAQNLNTMVMSWLAAFKTVGSAVRKGPDGNPTIPEAMALDEMGMLGSAWQNTAAAAIEHDLSILENFLSVFGDSAS